MQTIQCPRCSAPLIVRPEAADERGRVRLACDGCGAPVLVKVNARALRLSPDMPITVEPADDVPMAGDRGEPVAQWALLVHELPSSAAFRLRQALLSLPRYRSNPNKLHDLIAELPYVFHGLPRGEAAFLHRELTELAAEFESGAQDWLLDANLVPVAPDLRGPRYQLETLDGPEEEETDSAAELDTDGDPLEVAFDVSELRQDEESWMADEEADLVLLGESDEDEHPEALLLAELDGLGGDDELDGLVFGAIDGPSLALDVAEPPPHQAPPARAATAPDAAPTAARATAPDAAPVETNGGSVVSPPASLRAVWQATDFATTGEAAIHVESGPEVAAPPRTPPPDQGRPALPVALQDECPDTEESGDEMSLADAREEPDIFPIVTVDQLQDRQRVLGGVAATITRSSSTFDEGADATSDAAVRDGLAALRQRAEALGGDGIVGLRVATSALPSKIGWIQIYVLTGTVVAR